RSRPGCSGSRCRSACGWRKGPADGRSEGTRRPPVGRERPGRTHRSLCMSPSFAHPGSITFIDADGTERTEPADRLPDWVKFAPGSDGRAWPVVRVARVPAAGGYSVRSFGADGRL